MSYKYFDGRLYTTTADTDDLELYNSDGIQKPATLLGIAIQADDNKADLDIHATYNGQEFWPDSPIEAAMDSQFIPLMHNCPVGGRIVVYVDNNHATNTHDLELMTVWEIGALVNKFPRVFVDAFLGSTAVAQINRTFPTDAIVRWINMVDGELNIRIGGQQLSPTGAGNGCFTWGSTALDTPGIVVNWPLRVGNAFVVTANAAVATEGIAIYDVS